MPLRGANLVDSRSACNVERPTLHNQPEPACANVAVQESQPSPKRQTQSSRCSHQSSQSFSDSTTSTLSLSISSSPSSHRPLLSCQHSTGEPYDRHSNVLSFRSTWIRWPRSVRLCRDVFRTGESLLCVCHRRCSDDNIVCTFLER